MPPSNFHQLAQLGAWGVIRDDSCGNAGVLHILFALPPSTENPFGKGQPEAVLNAEHVHRQFGHPFEMAESYGVILRCHERSDNFRLLLKDETQTPEK